MNDFLYPENKPVNIKTAAYELGLSPSTVSRALSGKGRVSSATQAKVIEWAQKNAWIPSPLSRTLLHGRTNNIAILLPEEPNDEITPFFHYCVLGICEAAEVLDYDVLVINSSENDPSKLEQVLHNNKVDGVILTSRVAESFYDALRRAEIPFVLIGTIEQDDIVQIDHDVQGASRQLTALMLDGNIDKIAYLGGNQAHLVNQYREYGFYCALRDVRGFCDRSLIFTGLDNPIKMEQTIMKIIERKIQGIVVSDDVLCSIIIAQLNWLGVGIPKEIQVASCYHSYLLDIQAPQVTCVKSNPKKLSSEAAQMLIRMINGGEVPHRKLLEHEILVRGSTAHNRISPNTFSTKAEKEL